MSAPGVRTLVVALAVAASVLVAGGVGSARVADRAPRPAQQFPHEAHAGLFPVCTGCHAGVPQGDTAAFYPASGVCAACHDGVDLDRVPYTPPSSRVTNLKFTHPAHGGAVGAAGDSALACGTCHVRPDGPLMAVDSLDAGVYCLTCHGHQASSHFDNAPCATCHVPLAETSFSAERVASLPAPGTHGEPDFVLRLHGSEAQAGTAACATCHVRQRCLSCHVAGTEAEIAAIPAAPPSMELPRFAAFYPTPPSHLESGFESSHGELASAGDCATCHTREDCASCHTEPLPDRAAALPSRTRAAAPGVGLQAHLPASHRSPFFLRSHQTLAASKPDACATCHTQAYCAECHDGTAPASFHPDGFVDTHPAAAYGREMECANCHDAEAFCRACHVQVGFGSQGRLGGGFHDAQPLWLLRHGQAARQNLESCASCHRQTECLQCHSQRGSFQVSPHGPGFDAQRAWERAPNTCFACHLGRPPGVGE